jgi:hypothetical protein
VYRPTKDSSERGGFGAAGATDLFYGRGIYLFFKGNGYDRMAIPQILKPMKTESRRVFTCGFALTESELRRLHEVLVQQIKRTPTGDAFHATYEVKYRNGSVSHPLSVDDVLTQENFGSGSIVRLKMGVEGDGEEKTANQISQIKSARSS